MSSKTPANTAAPEGVDAASLHPWRSQVLVRVLDPAEQTQGGIWVPPTASDEPDVWDNSKPPMFGLIVRYGPDVRECTKSAAVHRNAVVFLPNSGVMFVADRDRLIVFDENAIMGICSYIPPTEI